jgi:hypothetical protein
MNTCVVFYDDVQSVSFALVIYKKLVVNKKFFEGLD